MDRLVMLLICMLVGAAGGVAWEHRPPIGFKPPWLARKVLKTEWIGLPDGLQTQLERAQATNLQVKTNLQVCRGNESTLRTALAGQNAAVTALAKDSDRRARELAEGLQRAAGAIATAKRRAAAMDFTPTGETVCERFLDVDRHVVESRR